MELYAKSIPHLYGYVGFQGGKVTYLLLPLSYEEVSGKGCKGIPQINTSC